MVAVELLDPNFENADRNLLWGAGVGSGWADYVGRGWTAGSSFLMP